MKLILTHVLLLISINSVFAQWSITNCPPAGRFDDITFSGDSVGWAVSAYDVYKTTDGGNTWNQIYHPGFRCRSIEFVTPTLGFLGTVSKTFLKSTDGGYTWIDIHSQLDTNVNGICGIYGVDSNVIYGAGVWSSPAWLIKTTDGGNTWTSTDMSPYCSAMIDVYFLNPDTGFVSGTDHGPLFGGCVYRTNDGGITWNRIVRTNGIDDVIWKLQSPDKRNIYGAVQPSGFTGPVTYLHSPDSGNTWNQDTVKVNNHTVDAFIQVIGFIDSLHGWTGADLLFGTSDGGITWDTVDVGGFYDRFYRMNDSTAFLTGLQIYKYTQGTSTALNALTAKALHHITVTPNPVSNILTINITLDQRTNSRVCIISPDNKQIKTITNGWRDKGDYTFTVNMSAYTSQLYYIILNTNEGMTGVKVLKE